MFGGLVYPGFLIALAVATNYPWLAPGSFALVSIITVVCAGVRLAQGIWFPFLYRRHPHIWRTLLWGAVCVTALTWGSFLGLTFWRFSYYDWKTLILLICISGTAPVSLASFAPSLRLLYAYQILLCTPMIAANFASGGAEGYTMAAIFFWYLVFILMFTQRSHFEYRELIEREEIELARRAAEEASRAKSDLLAHISHELRTPMNAIVGMTHLAITTNDRTEQRRYLEIVQESSQYLVRLLNDLLDVSRMNGGRLALDVAPVDLRRLAHGVVASFDAQARGLGLALHTVIEPRVPAWVYADAGRLRQVLVNLVGNAVKFTEHGSVQLRIQVAGEDETSAVLRFAVIDTGVGIPPDRCKVLFDIYGRAAEPEPTRRGGMGLGLAITSRLVSIMGGTLEVDSTPGKGSTFHWTLTMRKAPPGKSSPPAAGSSVTGRPIRILVGEDNRINQLLVRRLLERRNHFVRVATNGYEVLQALEEAPFDLVLMDIKMPGLDGLQTTSAIRRLEAVRGGAVPIVALTANAQEAAREECLRCGMNGYLAKPVDPNELYQVVEEYAARAQQQNRMGDPR